MRNGRVVVFPPQEVIEVVQLSTCLVCQFFDKQLPFFLVKRSVQTLWKPFGGVEVLTFENGLFLFKFVLVQDRDAILDARLWYVANNPLFL